MDPRSVAWVIGNPLFSATQSCYVARFGIPLYWWKTKQDRRFANRSEKIPFGVLWSAPTTVMSRREMGVTTDLTKMPSS
jgi:hypothetical protein